MLNDKMGRAIQLKSTKLKTKQISWRFSLFQDKLNKSKLFMVQF